MRQTFCLFLVILLAASSCSDIERIPSALQYQYPYNAEGKANRFFFRKVVSAGSVFDTLVVFTQRIIREDGEQVMISETKNSDGSSPTIERFSITAEGFKLIGAIYYFLDSATGNYIPEQATILEYKSKPGNHREVIAAIKLEHNNVLLNNRTEDTFIREDSITIMNKRIKSLVYKQQLIVKSRHRYMFFVSNETTYQIDQVWGEGLGMVQYSVDYGEGKETWELVRIEREK